MFNHDYESLANKKMNWRGYYEQYGQKSEMKFKNMLVGLNGAIIGAGQDEVGHFQIQG
jgi:hypothetical protein